MRLLNQLCLISILLVSPIVCGANETITVVSWGGVYENAQRRAIFEPFTEATGVKVKAVTYKGGIDAIQSRSEAESWDVIDMIEDQAILACDTGLLTKLDANQVAVMHQSVSIQEDFVAGAFRDCSVAQNIYSTVFAYDERAFLGEKPETIEDFFDLKRFPGKRALLRNPDVILEWALIAMGVPVGQVYDLLSTDRGLRLAFRKLEVLRNNVVWWTDVGEPSQLLSEGEVVMASGYNGRFFAAVQDDGIPITIVWDGQVLSYDVWGISSISKNKEISKQYYNNS